MYFRRQERFLSSGDINLNSGLVVTNMYETIWFFEESKWI